MMRRRADPVLGKAANKGSFDHCVFKFVKYILPILMFSHLYLTYIQLKSSFLTSNVFQTRGSFWIHAPGTNDSEYDVKEMPILQPITTGQALTNDEAPLDRGRFDA
jgi:hypothetical protein